MTLKEQTDRIKAGLRRDLRPVRALPPEWLLGLAFSLLVWLPPMAFALLGTREGFRTRTGSGLIPWAICLLGALPLGRAAARLIVPGSTPARGTAWGLGGIALLLAATAGGARSWGAAEFGRHESDCFQLGFAVAAACSMLAALIASRGYVLRWRESSLVLGILCGGAGFAVLEGGCPITEFWHLALSHIGSTVAMLMLALGGGAAIERRLRMRRGIR